MKKLLLILTTLALLAVVPPMQSSWYYAYIVSPTGWALHQDLGWVNLRDASFDTSANNLFTLTGDTFYPATPGALVNLSGSCRQGKPSHVTIQLVIAGYAAPLTIADTSDAAFSFSVPVVAGNMQIQGLNNDAGRYDVLKCSLLIEKVQ